MGTSPSAHVVSDSAAGRLMALCGDRMNNVERQREHFEEIAARYTQARKDEKHLILKEAIWRSFFGGFILPEKENMRVLEAMCGEAEGVNILADRFRNDFSYSAFDYSPSMVAAAHERHPEARIWEQNILTFDAREEYDVILIIGGLHHVYEYREEVLRRLNRALAPGGFFLSVEPTHNNILFRTLREWIYKRNALFDQETERAFEGKELNALLAQHGFKIVHQIFPGLLAYVLWYNPDAFPLLNRGSARFARWWIDYEKRFWHMRIARLLSFMTISCFQKVNGAL